MRKILTSIAVISIISISAYAQEPIKVDATEIENQKMHDKMLRKEKREEKMTGMSSEQKERMMARKEKFKSLSPEKQQAAKAEMKRHREEMRKITGEKMGDFRNEKNN